MGKREELEAKLIENPNDVELRMVYADLLQSTGDPRGELIVLSHRGDELGVVRGVVAVLRIARAVDARCAAERVDLETAVVGERG